MIIIRAYKGRAIAQAVSRWLPTAAAHVRARVWSCGIFGGQSGAGAGFLRVLKFPLPIFIPPIAPQSSSSIIWGLYNRPEVAAAPRDLVPPHKIKKNYNYRVYIRHVLYGPSEEFSRVILAIRDFGFTHRIQNVTPV
jgi:hypothetical protein